MACKREDILPEDIKTKDVEDKSTTVTQPHSFYIPVMGTGFTIDAPVRVARYGINSVLSIGDDILIESMRKQLCREFGHDYCPIDVDAPDARVNRITAYLNLLNQIVVKQVENLRGESFEPGSDICRYFELLPEAPLKREYRRMMTTTDPELRKRMQDRLRSSIRAGSIDVNIMTKVDGTLYRRDVKNPDERTLAVSALHGYARSDLHSSIVFSAGMNRRLFGNLGQFSDFFIGTDGEIKKKIILKVSNFRSAEIQGKLLASKGIWVSEYRVESGLNCGGHAFPTRGNLMGPIIETFRTERSSMLDRSFTILIKALTSAGRPIPRKLPSTRFTVQGGIGTFEEDCFLRHYYDIDGTGWGTPFLLVPEVTNIDNELLSKLERADESDIFLSAASPLGVPFWNLHTSASEISRRSRIKSGHPGSPCPKGYLRYNTDYPGQPMCTASRAYQARKLAEIAAAGFSSEQKKFLTDEVLAKACICHELSGGAAIKHGFDPEIASAICPGPGIADFSRVASLDEMVDHIYGRFSLITNGNRPHMFIRELKLYMDYLKTELDRLALGLARRNGQYYMDFRDNLQAGIEYYFNLADKFTREQRGKFLADLNELSAELKTLIPEGSAVQNPLDLAIASNVSPVTG